MDLTTSAQNNLEIDNHVVGDELVTDDVASLDVAEVQTHNPLLGLYIAIGIFFALFGTLENSIVIYLFTRKNSSYAGNAYVIALAVLDILACTVMVQTFPFEETAPRSSYAYAAMMAFGHFLMISYLCILAAMSLERLMAVNRPIKYGQMKGWHKCIVPGIMLTEIVIQISVTVLRLLVSREMASMVNIIVLIVVVSSSFVLILVSYTIILRKLLKQNQLVQPNTVLSHPAVSQAEMKNANAKHTRHVTTVKVFVGVTILFLASYIPVVFRVLMLEALYLQYLYMINHIGNPIIYYALNKKFREDANALGRKWLQTFQNFTYS